MSEPPHWTTDQLTRQATAATELFRKARMEEPLEEYLEAFDKYQGFLEDLLETTVDLTQLENQVNEVVTNPDLLEAFRYLAGPPISTDDLKVLADAAMSPKKLKSDPAMVKRILQVVLAGLDRRRFPWVIENREPTESEKNAAVVASAVLLATSRAGTARRHLGKEGQEEKVEEAFLRAGYQKVPTRAIHNLSDASQAGQFCRESLLGNRKADFVLGLFDRRVVAIECKVSNSATNSVKRLNNDAAAKAEAWRRDFGNVPAAVLGGVYKIHNLQDAQDRGLALFWAHDLDEFVGWIESTRPA
jgi:hypothetical protein